MMPPSSWLSASVGLMMRPASCAATIRSTRTMPVSRSTSTSANCAPKVMIAVSAGFGPRDPFPMIITLPSFAVTSAKVIVRSVSRTTMRESRASSASGAASSMAAAASKSWRRASSAAMRTAGPTDAVVIEPQEFPVYGRLWVSPMMARTSDSFAPKLSAAICERTVRAPVPRSWVPARTSTVASEFILTRA